MKFLILADFHHYTDEDYAALKNAILSFDEKVFCIGLGDIPYQVFEDIRNISYTIPMFGVYGNHDERFNKSIFEDMDGLVFGTGNFTFAGIGGSHAYKSGEFMLTQEQSLKIAKSTPKADILFTHDCAFGALPSNHNDPAHCGLKGIAWYLKTHKPVYHFHGHLHKLREYRFQKTNCVCVYRAIIFDYDGKNGTIEKLF
jgi:Icc-related predicted phosphoesterase